MQASRTTLVIASCLQSCWDTLLSCVFLCLCCMNFEIVAPVAFRIRSSELHVDVVINFMKNFLTCFWFFSAPSTTAVKSKFSMFLVRLMECIMRIEFSKNELLHNLSEFCLLSLPIVIITG